MGVSTEPNRAMNTSCVLHIQVQQCFASCPVCLSWFLMASALPAHVKLKFQLGLMVQNRRRTGVDVQQAWWL